MWYMHYNTYPLLILMSFNPFSILIRCVVVRCLQFTEVLKEILEPHVTL